MGETRENTEKCVLIANIFPLNSPVEMISRTNPKISTAISYPSMLKIMSISIRPLVSLKKIVSDNCK